MIDRTVGDDHDSIAKRLDVFHVVAGQDDRVVAFFLIVF